MDIVAPPPAASPPTSADAQVAAASDRPRVTSFKEVFAALSERMDRGEAAVQGAMHAAPKLGPTGELLMLQAGVYQYTESFEVAAKMVDKATNAIKTTLQNQ